MKVREIILELAKYDLDKEVVIHVFDKGEYDITLNKLSDVEPYLILFANLFKKKGDYYHD